MRSSAAAFFFALSLACDPKTDSGHTGGAVDTPAETDGPEESSQDSDTAPPPDTGSGGGCASEPLPEAGPAEGPTCTPLEGVSWDLVVEWEAEIPEEYCHIAGVMPDASGGGGLVSVTCANGVVYTISGISGDAWAIADSDVDIEADSGAMARSEVGGDPIIAFDDDYITDGLSFVTLSDGLVHHVDVEDGQNVYRPVALRDLDRDGRVEIVSNVLAVTLDGETHATWPEPYKPGEGYPLVADLHQDGRLWIVNKSGIWSAEDGEGEAWPLGAAWRDDVAAFQKVVLAKEGSLVQGLEMNLNFRLVDLEMSTLWKTPIEDEPNSNGHADVSAGDADGDEEPELCVPSVFGLLLLSLDGDVEQLWARSASNYITGGCTLADLDADGDHEVIDYGYADGLWILDGRTGDVLASDPSVERIYFNGAPIVADLDGDGGAEILLQSGERNEILRAYGPATGRWARTRQVWHQRSYDITSVSDDGTILTWPFPSWEAYNAFRAQPAHDGAHPDLQVEAAWACADACVDGQPQGTVQVAAQVSNTGSVDATGPVTVRLSVWDPEAPVPELTEVSSVVLSDPVPSMRAAPGALLEVPADQWTGFQVLQVDGSHADECDRVNDRIELRLDPCG